MIKKHPVITTGVALYGAHKIKQGVDALYGKIPSVKEKRKKEAEEKAKQDKEDLLKSYAKYWNEPGSVDIWYSELLDMLATHGISAKEFVNHIVKTKSLDNFYLMDPKRFKSYYFDNDEDESKDWDFRKYFKCDKLYEICSHDEYTVYFDPRNRKVYEIVADSGKPDIKEISSFRGDKARYGITKSDIENAISGKSEEEIANKRN